MSGQVGGQGAASRHAWAGTARQQAFSAHAMPCKVYQAVVPA